jgi:hypothetical protein
MPSITNITNGPKGVHGRDGIVVLQAGETAEVEMGAGEIASSARTGWFEGFEPEDGDALDALKAQADELGIDYPEAIGAQALKALIDAALAA